MGWMQVLGSAGLQADCRAGLLTRAQSIVLCQAARTPQHSWSRNRRDIALPC